MTKAQSCAMCRAQGLDQVAGFAGQPRVTSDCRPYPPGGRLAICPRCGLAQKPVTAAWLDEIGEIYGGYDMFRQASDGDEQLVFVAATGAAVRRSFAMLQQIAAIGAFPASGAAIDIGCGNGAMLKAISHHASGWPLDGVEQSDRTLPQLRSIRGFRHLHTDMPDAAGVYDLVTASHVLEHLVDPIADLARMARLVAPTGLLIAQVPDNGRNAFDVLVADHRTHFTARTLMQCARAAGLVHLAVTDRLVPKELTLVASRDAERLAPYAEALSARPGEGAGMELTHAGLGARIAWFAAVLQAAHKAAREARAFGVFGTSIAGTWLFGAMRHEAAFFVDEDPSRVGRQHEGRPIIAPKDVPAGATVFLCLIPEVAAAVHRRLAGESAGCLVLPPPLAA